MRIGLLAQSIDRRTGIGRIANALATEFVGRGHAVYCTAQNLEREDARVRTCRIPRVPFSKGLSKVLLRYYKSPFESDVDMFHSFGVGRGAQVVSAQSCHRAGLQLLRDTKYKERLTTGFYDSVSLGDERALLTSHTTRRVVAVSQLVSRQIQEYYDVDPGMISIVPNGVDQKFFERLASDNVRPRIRKEFGLREDDFVLLFVGNEFSRKGLDVLISVLRGLANKHVHLLVAGGGNRAGYARLAADAGVAGQVKFVGSSSNPEPIYMAADMFVLPAIYEPFGIVVLEAMAAGVPVVVSRVCGAAEGMLHRHDLFLLEDHGSVEELVEAIRQVRQDETLRRTMSEAGRIKAKEFSWDLIATKMLGVYSEVMRSQ